MRKLGVRLEDLNQFCRDNLWSELSDLNLQQFLRLEIELKKANNTDSKMHSLYGQNIKTKKLLVPENQQIAYESSQEKFGKIAIRMAGTDETIVNEIIDDYLEAGIDLTGSKGE